MFSFIENLEYKNEWTDQYFIGFSESTGLPMRGLELVFLLFLNYPISYAFKYLPKKSEIRHLVGILVGVFEFWFCLGFGGGIHAFLSSTISYLILSFGSLRSVYTPIINFVWVFGYLSVAQIWRVYNDYQGVDIDWISAQMVLTIKLTTVVWDLHDATLSEPERQKKLTLEQQEFSSYLIKKTDKGIDVRRPSLLEWYGYVFFYAGFLAGPAFKFQQYLKYIELTQFDNKDCNGKIPSSGMAAFKKMTESLIFLALHLVLNFIFPPTLLFEMATQPIYKRFIYVWILPALHRVPYYFVWNLTEGAFIANGMAYSGPNEWELMSNVKAIEVEFGLNIYSIVANWNCKTQTWLKNYIYLRISPISEKPTWFTMFATYGISAFWHGFYSGYYFFFIGAAVETWISRQFRSKLRPIVIETKNPHIKRLYDVAGWFFSHYILGYFGASFVMLKLSISMEIWSSVYYIGHLLLLFGLIFVQFLPRPKPQIKELKQKSK